MSLEVRWPCGSSMANIQTAVAAEVEARSNSGLDYNRPPDQSIIVLHTREGVEYAAMEEACQAWLRPLSQDDQWQLSGEKQNYRV